MNIYFKRTRFSGSPTGCQSVHPLFKAGLGGVGDRFERIKAMRRPTSIDTPLFRWSKKMTHKTVKAKVPVLWSHLSEPGLFVI